jgi:hypothetical protein
MTGQPVVLATAGRDRVWDSPAEPTAGDGPDFEVRR